MQIARSTGLFCCIAFLVAALGPSSAHAAPVPDGFVERTLKLGDVNRHFLLYKPDPKKKYAASIVLLHGGGQSMRKLFGPGRAAMHHWKTLAERDGLLLIAPNGVNARTGDPASDRQAWNDLRQAREVGNSTADDIQFIRTLLTHLGETYDWPTEATYVTGASNGGMMTFRLLIEQPGLFAAGVVFISNLPKEKVPVAAQPTPLMIVNGTEDKLILYNGGPVAGGRRGETRSTDATLDYWITTNRASRAAATTRLLPDLDPQDGCRLEETAFPALKGGADVTFIKMDGGGHTLPAAGAKPMRRMAKWVLGPRCGDAHAADLAWEFFRQY